MHIDNSKRAVSCELVINEVTLICLVGASYISQLVCVSGISTKTSLVRLRLLGGVHFGDNILLLAPLKIVLVGWFAVVLDILLVVEWLFDLQPADEEVVSTSTEMLQANCPTTGVYPTVMITEIS